MIVNLCAAQPIAADYKTWRMLLDICGVMTAVSSSGIVTVRKQPGQSLHACRPSALKQVLLQPLRTTSGVQERRDIGKSKGKPLQASEIVSNP
jgi:hypothetical protein